MTVAWSQEQVLALAPDSGSAAAGRKLSTPAPWTGTGASGTGTSATGASGTPSTPPAVWGLCKGSGKTPYQTVVDLTGPAVKCSCPSRKFPCKHALGLLLLWSSGGVPQGQPPDWVASWLADRSERAEKAQAKADVAAQRAADPEAAAKRAQQRAARVTAGIDELDTWLGDQIRRGLAGLERGGYGPFETVAARMVDAQAPGLAGRLRSLRAVIAGGPGWPGRLLEQLALLHLTVSAHRNLPALPAGLAACVRREVGYPVAKDDVLATPPVTDTWQVLGLRDVEEDRLTTRRVWLRGQRTGRMALVLSFAAPGQPLDASLIPGTEVGAALHFYPGTAPLRALVGERDGEPHPLCGLAGGSLDDAARDFAAAVAADPWTSGWPVVLDGLVPVPDEPRWAGVDRSGTRIPLLAAAGGAGLWRLLAVSGGRGLTVAAEYSAAGLRPISAFDDDDCRLVPL